MLSQWKRFLLRVFICTIVLAVARTQADEIRLKDGKKLYGVIVAYEDNMFKVKTDFGFVLVEKDKIAAIIPSAPSAPTAPAAAKAQSKADSPGAKKPAPAKPEATRSTASPSAGNKTEASPATSSSPPAVSAPKPANLEDSRREASAAPKSEPAAKAPITTVAPAVPPKKSVQPSPSAAKIADVSPATNSLARSPTPPAAPPVLFPKAPVAPAIPMVTAIQPSKPKPVPPPVNRESLQGNTYINFTHGFRMYKAPSWKLIDDARKALPNAIVAMGTANESTLMVVAEEKSKNPLDATAADVEARLRDTYGNYRRISQKKTVAGGFPAVEIHYRGIAEDHDWSGTLLVVSRSGDMFSILGMTYSDTDLIQIQENVIARAISSLEFNSN